MGQSKGNGYVKQDTLSPEQNSLLLQILQQASPNLQQAAEGYKQFLPGGGGGKAIIDDAHRRFQQQTVPGILGSFGQGSKSSSALNQALAAGASDLNSSLSSNLAQMQLNAAGGLGSLGSGQSSLGLGTSQFAYVPQQQPFWQQALLKALGAGGQVGGAFIGRPGGF